MQSKSLLLKLILLFVVVTIFLACFIPETGFDALWYHLPLAKFYLNNGISHVPGGLFYYSEMPRFGELIFALSLKIFGDLGPHIVNFIVGLGIIFVLYQLAKKYLKNDLALLCCVIFYTFPLAGWQSTGGYVDLIRTFFEILAFWFFVQKKYIWLGVALGLTISTKTLALGSFFIFSILGFYQRIGLKNIAIYLASATLVSIPWFLSAVLNTGHIFYPIGAGILDSSHSVNLSFSGFFLDYWKVFMVPSDMISPVFVIFLPFFGMILFNKKILELTQNDKIVVLYFVFSYFMWYLMPKTGGGRFILAYLPIWTILVCMVVSKLESGFYRKLLTGTIVASILFNCIYRLGAVAKSWKYLLGKESETAYLCRNLDFALGNFVDCDFWFKNNISKNDLVLVSGVHNLYYLDFPFVHETWYRGEDVDYILVQGEGRSVLVEKLLSSNEYREVYESEITRTKVYMKKILSKPG